MGVGCNDTGYKIEDGSFHVSDDLVGARANRTVIARNLVQQDIENAAASHAAIPVTIGKPPH